MKFGERIKEEMLPEWAEFYIDYAKMKEIIGDITLDTEHFVKAVLAELRAELERAEVHMGEMVDQLSAHCDDLAKDTANDAFHELVVAAKSPTVSGKTIFPRKVMRRGGGGSSMNMVGSSFGSAGSANGGGKDAENGNEKEGAMREIGDSPNAKKVSHHTTLIEVGQRPVGYGSLSNNGNENGGGNNSATSLQGSLTAADTFTHDTNVADAAGDLADINRGQTARSPLDSPFTALGFLGSLFRQPAEALRAQNARRRYAAWYSSATRLIHFAELNIEAMYKTCKKAHKVRPNAKLKARFASEMQHNKLHEGITKINEMINRVKKDFSLRFSSELQQYADVSMPTSETWGCKWRYLFLSTAIYVAARLLPIFEDHPPAHHCFALFSLVITLWITEAIPFFCTAMLIPLIAVPTDILRDPSSGKVASAEIASKILMGRIFDHVQILVLGGLVIAKAMSRTQLEFTVAQYLHQRTAHSPKIYLLGVMLLSCFMSTFVSNIASPLLVLSVLQPTLWEFPAGSKAPQGILLALAFSCNIGGMLSPIASPQNAVAMQVLSANEVTFLKWVLATLPLALAGVVAAWAVVLIVWKPFEGIDSIPLQSTARGKPVPRIHTHIVVLTTLLTVVLWCLPPQTFFGDAGVVALIPLVVFFGSGILKKDDFNKLSWHLMFLLAGGNMLGTCAKDSKMLDLLASSLRASLGSEPPFVTLWAVLISVLAITTFVSHTVAAMILLPIIAKIGAFLPAAAASTGLAMATASANSTGASSPTALFPTAHSLLEITPEALVFLSALMCSAAMAFPVSSFPNVNSLLAEDETGRPFLKARDFLLPGTIVTVFLGVCGATWMVPWFNFVA